MKRRKKIKHNENYIYSLDKHTAYKSINKIYAKLIKIVTAKEISKGT